MADTDLRSTFYEVLTRLLSVDLTERQLAEQQLQALQVTEGKSKLSKRSCTY